VLFLIGDLQFSQKSEPATLPRVAQIIIITQYSPWCTIVKNDKGVTNEDVINALWKEYVFIFIFIMYRTDVEPVFFLLFF